MSVLAADPPAVRSLRLSEDHTEPTERPRLLRAVPTDPPFDDAEVWREPAAAIPLILCVPRLRGDAELDLPDLAGPIDDVWNPAEEGGSRAVDAELRRLFGRRRTPRCELPAPGPRAAAAVRLLLEVLVGDRPTRQVAGWVSPPVLAALELRSPRQRRAMPRRPLLRSLRVLEPSDGVAEVCAVVQTGARHRAVALRLDGLDGRWTVTALHVG